MTDTDLIAAFLATRGATQCVTAPAYGVDPDADKLARARARDVYTGESDVAHDRRMTAAHDAFFTGDKAEGHRLLGARFTDSEPAEPRPDGRRVRLNRF